MITREAARQHAYTYYDYLFHLPIAEQQTFAKLRAIHRLRPEPWAVDPRVEQGAASNVAKAKKTTRDPRSTSSRSCQRFRSGTTGWAQYNTQRLDQLLELIRCGAQTTPAMWNGTST